MSEVTEIKTLNGYPLADTKARADIATLSEEIDDISDALFTSVVSDELIEVPKDDMIVEPEKFAAWGSDGPIKTLAACDLWRIPVTKGQKHYITNQYLSAAALYIYVGENDAVIEKFPTSQPASKQTVQDYEVTAPEGAKYLLVNYLGRWQNFETVVKTNKVSDEKVFSAAALVSQYIYNPLYGKKLVHCGDSITEARNPDGGNFYSYGEIVANRNGMTCVKDGIGGSTMTNVEGKNPFCVSRYLNHTDFDYLTIWFGWNDGAYATLGTIEDTEDTTFYGAYKKVLTHYVTNYPTKKIGIVVPYGFRTNIQQAVREISEMFGVPCLDLADGKRCSLIWGEDNDAQLARRAALTYDTTHPNQAGHEFIATMYEHFLRSL